MSKSFALFCTLAAIGCSSSSSNNGLQADGGGPSDTSTPETSIDGGASSDSAPSEGGEATVVSDGGCVGSVPLTYLAATDRQPHQVSPPALGPAGSVVKDPVYGTPILRLTDATTVSATTSFRVANEFWGNDWNTDSTLFYLQESSSGLLLYSFDPKSFTAARVPDMKNPGQALRMPIYGGGFSRVSPSILYGMKGLTVAKYDFTTQTETDLVDLTTIVPGVTGNVLGIEEGANGLLATSFGGPQQDEMPYVATWDPSTGTHHIIDVTKSTLDGNPVGATIGGGVHTIRIDKSGQFVTFSVSGTGVAFWIWDTAAGKVTPLPGGGAVGWGAWIHGSRGDSYQWALSTYASPTMSTPLVSPLLTPTDTLASSGASWENSTAGALAPVIVETMRQPTDMGPWRAWDEEILAVRTDGTLVADEAGVQESEVWRFAHTFNTYSGTTYSDNYYYLFIPRVSQNGWFVLFDSNWNGSLGTDTAGNARTDAFIVALPNPCGP